jgi:hypothetical protein
MAWSVSFDSGQVKMRRWECWKCRKEYESARQADCQKAQSFVVVDECDLR